MRISELLDFILKIVKMALSNLSASVGRSKFYYNIQKEILKQEFIWHLIT